MVQARTIDIRSTVSNSITIVSRDIEIRYTHCRHFPFLTALRVCTLVDGLNGKPYVVITGYLVASAHSPLSIKTFITSAATCGTMALP